MGFRQLLLPFQLEKMQSWTDPRQSVTGQWEGSFVVSLIKSSEICAKFSVISECLVLPTFEPDVLFSKLTAKNSTKEAPSS